MVRLIHSLWKLTKSKQMLGSVWLPIPLWLKKYIKRYTLQKQVHTYAQLMVGKDLSFLVDKEIACSEAVTRILVELGIMPSVITGTYTLYEHLHTSIRFVRVQTPQAGDIILSPTGMGIYKHGHVGIMDSNNRILSNSSASGIFTRTHTLASWTSYYKVNGGFPIFFYRVIK